MNDKVLFLLYLYSLHIHHETLCMSLTETDEFKCKKKIMLASLIYSFFEICIVLEENVERFHLINEKYRIKKKLIYPKLFLICFYCKY